MNRVLLKLSGEALAGDKKTGFDEETCVAVAKQVKKIVDQGVQVAIVIGGGNFWRGRTSNKIDRPKADGIGMLATIMNCMYVSEIFRTEGMDTNIYTPFLCGTWTKLFSKDEAVSDLQAGKVIFFAGGTGHPYFSTDMSMVLRAIEIEADCILGAKAVDGVYDSDPATNPDAKKYDELPISKIVDERLGVIDLAASVLAMENKMPMLLFGLNEENSIERAACGEKIGTKITVE
ncbi:MAG: UMP kinase [Eubacterium sp.]|nr:UMP kinase [Eubacterium sp.]